jgi:hypothetical protein
MITTLFLSTHSLCTSALAPREAEALISENWYTPHSTGQDMKVDKSFTWHHVDPQALYLKGLKVAIIGGTAGIGRGLSRFMASRGAKVLVVGRTFRDSDISDIEFIKADLSLMREAKRVGELLPAETLDLILFTTGILAAPKRQETPEGIERDTAVSYLSRSKLYLVAGLQCSLCECLCEISCSNGSNFHKLSFLTWTFQ